MNTEPWYVIVRERDGSFYNADNCKFYRSVKRASKMSHLSAAKSYLPFLTKQGPLTILGLYS